MIRFAAANATSDADYMFMLDMGLRRMGVARPRFAQAHADAPLAPPVPESSLKDAEMPSTVSRVEPHLQAPQAPPGFVYKMIDPNSSGGRGRGGAGGGRGGTLVKGGRGGRGKKVTYEMVPITEEEKTPGPGQGESADEPRTPPLPGSRVQVAEASSAPNSPDSIEAETVDEAGDVGEITSRSRTRRVEPPAPPEAEASRLELEYVSTDSMQVEASGAQPTASGAMPPPVPEGGLIAGFWAGLESWGVTEVLERELVDRGWLTAEAPAEGVLADAPVDAPADAPAVE